MLNVSISEFIIEKAIKSNLFNKDYSVHFDDSQIVKCVLNQLFALNLISSYWSKSKDTLFWELTEKGEKIRNDLMLMRNENISTDKDILRDKVQLNN